MNEALTQKRIEGTIREFHERVLDGESYIENYDLRGDKSYLEKKGFLDIISCKWEDDAWFRETILAALDAVRWRDPAVELPEAYETVLDYRHRFLYVDDEGGWWRTGLYGPDVRIDDVVVWLPIPTWEEDSEA